VHNVVVFEAILFLAGAVLFFLCALFFVFLWQDRMSLIRRKAEMEVQVAELKRQTSVLKEQRVDIDIWEHELRVWAEGLEHQQAAIEKAQEELRMLTATKAPVAAASPGGDLRDSPMNQQGEPVRGEQGMIKNAKRQTNEVKLPK
jgi:hypothetical protein